MDFNFDDIINKVQVPVLSREVLNLEHPLLEKLLPDNYRVDGLFPSDYVEMYCKNSTL
jgi:hypothetical protein